MPERKFKFAAPKSGNPNGSPFNVRFGSADIMPAANYNVYSPYYSADFLEQPLTVGEKRRWFRHFYDKDPIVGRAIDLHTDLPISKIRLTYPKCKDKKKAAMIYDFYMEMIRELSLFRRLIEMTHEYNLLGDVFIFAEWSQTDKKWTNLVILDPDLVKVTTYPLTNQVRIELIPDPAVRDVIMNLSNDPEQQAIIDSMPPEIVDKITNNEPLLMDTDPETGSHVYHLSRRRSHYYEMGTSMLERLLTTLLYRDKLRQAQTMIATRNMTPKHLVWADDISPDDANDLRDQVDLAQVDPEFAIVTNYEVHWDMVGANDRILDLTSEWDQTEKLLMVGLGMTSELLTGEGMYSGGRIALEVMNTVFMLYREILQDYVDNDLFRTVAIANEFYEKDDNGNDVLIYPRLSFTRLSIRDNADTFDALFNLYQKGSIPVSVILDLLNIEPESTEERLKKDLLGVNDANFNELMRTIYQEAGRKIVETSNISKKLSQYLGITNPEDEEPPAQEGMVGVSSEGLGSDLSEAAGV